MSRKDEDHGREDRVVHLVRTTSQPSLADVGMLHDLVMAVAHGAMQGMKALSRDEVGHERLQSDDDVGARRLARILLGQEKGFAPVPGWNEPGGVDEAVARRFNLHERDPEDRLVSAIRGVQFDAKLAAYMALKGAEEAEWRRLIQDTVNGLVEVLLPAERRRQNGC